MDLELRVARALGKATLMERILHGRGRWQISLGTWGVSTSDLVVEATRVVSADAAAVEAEFPAHCWLHPTKTVLLSLLYDGEIVGVREVRHPGDGSFVAVWEVSLQVVETAA